MTAALEGGEWSAARPGRTLPPGKTRYPFYRRLGGPQGRSGIRSRAVQPVVNRYIDWDTRPTHIMYRGADKSLARPGRKQSNVSVRVAWISFGALPSRKTTWWQLASRCCWKRARPWHASELVSVLVGLRTYQHPGSRYQMMGWLMSKEMERM